MAEATLSLTLSPVQRAQFFAHLLTYLLSLKAIPLESQRKATMSLVQEVVYRLFRLSGDEHLERAFSFSSEEIQAVKEAFSTLQPLYAQWPLVETSTFAFEHLASCLQLIEKAEQQAHAQAESR